MLRLRPNLILPISALFLFGGCSSCFGPEDQQGGCVADSAFTNSSCAEFFGPPCSTSDTSTTSSSSCSDVICCTDEHRGTERLVGFVADRCGCAPFVACADTCFSDPGSAARCGADGQTPNPLKNTACVDCVLQTNLGASCSAQAHNDCENDLDCASLIQCLDGVGWPEDTSTGGSSSESNTGGSSLGGGGANVGGMSSQGGAGGSSGGGGMSSGGGHAARARR